ncbi:SDR family NAD(P)-dependent oxidoreductase [Mycobacterium sp.]|uniref:SDR family NAD(P)-dependent oxidoreductase n=1 Tax=Mycobacterium sp. TaxID=1785 RepID=UPI002D9D3195|nr:SDR family NAD(P)-dependent oxidoreductase [Mycobacterium sp.]
MPSAGFSVSPEAMNRWLGDHIGDQSGRTFLITGANGGLGTAAARHLAGAGARVILACRRPDQGEALADRIGSAAEVLPVDLSDLASISKAAAACGQVDAVLAIAGVCYVPWGLTADGFELHIGINHLGHFAFIGQILDRIGDRVVVVTSRAHEFVGRPGFGKLMADDPAWRTRKYSAFDAYCQAKLANLLFVNELHRRFEAAGSPLTAVAAQPGWSDTEAGMHTGRRFGDIFWRTSCRTIGQAADVGALSIVYAAASHSAQRGGYYGPNRLFGMRGLPAPASAGKAASDPELMSQMWAASERHTGVRFAIDAAHH